MFLNPLIPRIIFSLLAIGAGIAVFLVLTDDSDAPPVNRDAARSPIELTRHENADGDYEFEYPSAWDVTDRRTVSRVTSPDDDVIVSFGIAPRGDLLLSSDRLIELLREQYSPLEIEDQEIGSVGGELSMFREGTATRASGEDFNFETVTVQAPKNNYAIAAFVSRTETTDLDARAARKIIRSFEVIQ